MVSRVLGRRGRRVVSQSAEATKCNDYGPFTERSKSRAPVQTCVDSAAIDLLAKHSRFAELCICCWEDVRIMGPWYLGGSEVMGLWVYLHSALLIFNSLCV